MSKDNLEEMQCTERTAADRLDEQKASEYLKSLAGWRIENGTLCKDFKFADFSGSVGFVNKIAVIANQQNHHPDVEIRWNRVKLSFMTHSIKSLSLNDFIMAAKVDKTL